MDRETIAFFEAIVYQRPSSWVEGQRRAIGHYEACAALTRKGTPCRRHVYPNRNQEPYFCHMHDTHEHRAKWAAQQIERERRN